MTVSMHPTTSKTYATMLKGNTRPRLAVSSFLDPLGIRGSRPRSHFHMSNAGFTIDKTVKVDATMDNRVKGERSRSAVP